MFYDLIGKRKPILGGLDGVYWNDWRNQRWKGFRNYSKWSNGWKGGGGFTYH